MGILELRFLEKYGRLIFKQNNKVTKNLLYSGHFQYMANETCSLQVSDDRL